jgi:tRNA A37 methylthiotransferase MiaB
MTPAVPVEIRRKRAKELEALGAANRETFAKSFIGKEVEVCIEKDGNGYSGEYLFVGWYPTSGRYGTDG